YSRSRSIEPSTRSATSWPTRNAPDSHSIASTSVVLPWSTWATIATLRMSGRVGIAWHDTGRRAMAPSRLHRDDELAAGLPGVEQAVCLHDLLEAEHPHGRHL